MRVHIWLVTLAVLITVPSFGQHPVVDQAADSFREKFPERDALLPFCESTLHALTEDSNDSPVDPILCFGERDNLTMLKESDSRRVLSGPSEKTSWTLQESFEGIDETNLKDSPLGYLPADATIGVSKNRILQSTNSQLKLWFRTSGSKPIEKSLREFFLLPAQQSGLQTGENALIYDPRTYYDPLSSRFFIVASSRETDQERKKSTIHLAVSLDDEPKSLDWWRDNDNDNKASWCLYQFPGSICDNEAAGCQAWADFPQLGSNEKWLGITANQFNFADSQERLDAGKYRFGYSLLFLLDKKGLLDTSNRTCPQTKAYVYPIGLHSSVIPVDDVAYSVTPLRYENDYPKFMLFSMVRFRITAGDSQYILWWIDEDETDSPPKLPKLRSRRLIAEGTKSYGPIHQRADQKLDTELNHCPDLCPAGKETTLDVGPMRVLNVVQRDGRIFGVHPNFFDRSKEKRQIGFRLFRLPIEKLDFGSRESIPDDNLGFEHIDFFSPDHDSYWMPSLAVNKDLTVGVNFLRSSEKRHLGTAFHIIPKSEWENPMPELSPESLKEGECQIWNTLNHRENLTGDYLDIQVDPLDSESFWLTGEYAAKSVAYRKDGTTGETADGQDLGESWCSRKNSCCWSTRIGRVTETKEASFEK